MYGFSETTPLSCVRITSTATLQIMWFSSPAPQLLPQLYFLIAKFLSGGPLKETAKTLLKELESVEVLPRRLDWEGQEHAQSYDELASQHSDVPWSRLASVCRRALQLARDAKSAPGPSGSTALATPASASNGGAPAPPATEAVLRLTARLSLLSESLVRPIPKYASYKPDHSLVRRLVSRELGSGPAATVGGRGGEAVFPARMLAGLQLQRRTLGHLSAVYCLVFDCTGRYVITGADDLLVKVWSAVDGRLLGTLRGASAEITDVCASADGALLAAGSVEKLIRVWCLASGAPLAVLAGHAGTITAVHWAAPARARRWLASTSTDGSVAFWSCSRAGQFSAPPARYVERMRPGACHMICAAWSAGGGFLAAGSADHHVSSCGSGSGSGAEAEAGGPRRVLELAVHGDAVDSLAWAHRGLRFVSGSKDGSAALWALHATQWRHVLLRPEPAGPAAAGRDAKRLKVTMVCWDRSDEFVMTAVSDNTIRVWCSRRGVQTGVLRGHLDEAYVLEPHPFLAAVLLSAGHDGQLFVWDAAHAQEIAHYHNHIEGQGDGAIFDAKWGSGSTVAASDSHGHLLLLGLGQGHRLLRQLPTELFFHTDYRPLVRDALGGALDEQTDTPPHLMPPPFLVDVEGGPHAPRLQRLVPGRENLALSQLIPANERSRLDAMILALAGERAPIGVWRGEGVRHTAGSWQRGELPAGARTLVPPPPAAALRAYRREMRRRPLMICTQGPGPAGARRRAGRRPRPQPAPAPAPAPPEPEPDSDTSDDSSHSHSHSRGSSLDYTDTTSSESSQYSDWEAGAALAPPARSRRRPLPTNSFAGWDDMCRKGIQPHKHHNEAGAPAAAPGVPRRGPPGPPGPPASTSAAPSEPPPPEELPEAYRPGEWLTAVTPRKAPYHPQMGDECVYFRLGHQRYFEAVAEKDLYKINPRDKPWERTLVHECELVKVVGIKYVIKPPRVVCLKLACSVGRGRSFTVRYHDMADVIDFLVLRQQYELAVARRWAAGDRFRCIIDDCWWSGTVAERAAAPAPEPAAEPPGAAAAWAAAAAPHFLGIRVRWDNGEVERLSPWDLEPVDAARRPARAGGALAVLPRELPALLYRPAPHEWPPRGDRAAACAAIAGHLSQVMTLSAAEPFVAPVDLQLYPSYARVVPYPIDLATIRARFENLFYRRVAAAQFDVRYLASNAEQFNEPHAIIVRQARLITDLLLHIISSWDEVDVVAKYHELAASYQSSDDEPLAASAGKNRWGRVAGGEAGWRAACGALLRELCASADAEPFRHPVSADMAPDYRSVVSHPMDLGTVSSRLEQGYYSSADQFAADVRLVFANSRLYNTNKRSRIYSMTVRLSSLFEALWARVPPRVAPARTPAAAAAPAHARPRPRPRARPRRPRRATRATRAIADASEPELDLGVGLGLGVGVEATRSSSSEPLAATSRRVHARADSWDSDAPLHAHRKGKGVGKKSKSSSNSAEPAASTSGAGLRIPYDSDPEPTANGLGSRSSQSSSSSDTAYSNIEVVEEELAEDEVELTYDERTRGERTWKLARKRTRPASSGSASVGHVGGVRGVRGVGSVGSPPSAGSAGSEWTADRRKRPRRSKHAPPRTRERFTENWSSGSSSWSSGSEAGPGGSRAPGGSRGPGAADARRYESDHSYRPRYSTDDDAPLHLYRQRQQGGDEAAVDGSEGSDVPGPSSGRRRPGRSRSGGVSLRARRSPRQYNEDSEEDSVAAISKRLQHHRTHASRHHHLATRRRRHATQALDAGSLVAGAAIANDDHNYFNGHAHHHNGAAGGAGSAGSSGGAPVSISSRGRVRKLTPKARGLLRE
ncbi:LOW QUALITY PROTEIN: bromodomain and WD repeat-containing protein [Aphomia sociella]